MIPFLKKKFFGYILYKKIKILHIGNLLVIVLLDYLGPHFLVDSPQHVSYGAHQPDAQKSQFKIHRHTLLIYCLSSCLSFESDSAQINVIRRAYVSSNLYYSCETRILYLNSRGDCEVCAKSQGGRKESKVTPCNIQRVIKILVKHVWAGVIKVSKQGGLTSV